MSHHAIYRQLSPDEMTRLDKQRAVIAAKLKEKYGYAHPTETKADLQRLLDEHVFNPSQTYELQCLGVTFGDLLASEFPLKWFEVTDEFGTDPVLL